MEKAWIDVRKDIEDTFAPSFQENTNRTLNDAIYISYHSSVPTCHNTRNETKSSYENLDGNTTKIGSFHNNGCIPILKLTMNDGYNRIRISKVKNQSYSDTPLDTNHNITDFVKDGYIVLTVMFDHDLPERYVTTPLCVSPW